MVRWAVHWGYSPVPSLLALFIRLSKLFPAAEEISTGDSCSLVLCGGRPLKTVMSLSGEAVHDIEPESFTLQAWGVQCNLVIS